MRGRARTVILILLAVIIALEDKATTGAISQVLDSPAIAPCFKPLADLKDLVVIARIPVCVGNNGRALSKRLVSLSTRSRMTPPTA